MKILGYFASSKEAEVYKKAEGLDNCTVQLLASKNNEFPWALILPLQGKKQAE